LLELVGDLPELLRAHSSAYLGQLDPQLGLPHLLGLGQLVRHGGDASVVGYPGRNVAGEHDRSSLSFSATENTTKVHLPPLRRRSLKSWRRARWLREARFVSGSILDGREFNDIYACSGTVSCTSTSFAPGIYPTLVLALTRRKPFPNSKKRAFRPAPLQSPSGSRRNTAALKNGPLVEGPLHVEAAVDTPHLPGDIGGSVGSEEVYDPGDLLRPAQTAHRNL
jgi:hypothetical protein